MFIFSLKPWDVLKDREREREINNIEKEEKKYAYTPRLCSKPVFIIENKKKIRVIITLDQKNVSLSL
jgi:hypothetical protein